LKKGDYDLVFQRRHPDYLAHEASWQRSHDAYSGGSRYIERALIRHVSEIEVEFAERRKRAYYFNYPRAIAGRITQYALATDPVRRNADPTLLEDWSRNGLRVNEVMRQLSTMLNMYGRSWLQVESPQFTGRPSLAEAKKRRLRPYVRALAPFAVTDWAEGSDGKLLWAIVREDDYDNADPLRPAVMRHRCRLYERDKWRLFGESSSGITEISSGVNPAGVVPLIPVIEPDGFGLQADHWFDDVVRISDAILNNESEAQMNVVKQMFGLLVVSDAFARGALKQAARETVSGGSQNGFSAAIARSAAVIEAVEEKGISRFISPSGVETATIREENRKLKEELYEVVGLAVQGRTRQSQTAESKEWDFQNVEQFLATRAELLEQSETQAWQMMHAYDPTITVPEIIYNRKFAVRELPESIACLLQLAELNDSKAFHRAIDRAGLEMLDAVHSLPEYDKQMVLDEILKDRKPADRNPDPNNIPLVC